MRSPDATQRSCGALLNRGRPDASAWYGPGCAERDGGWRTPAGALRSLRQRATTLPRGRERFVAGHHREFLVIIPRLLRLRRLLYLEQIEVVHEASVGQHLALRKQIVDRKLLQLRSDRLCILGAGGL